MRVTWLPDFYQAGIAVTDDPDNGSFTQFKAIYDLLLQLKFPTSRAMWAFEEVEPTGTPPLHITFNAPLLVDTECLDYCRRLYDNGFEICLHGASSGNNTREKTIAASELLEREIAPARLFICHSKNAENLYWDSKCTTNPILSGILKLYSKNRCFGEVEGSPYFWGDYCRRNIDYIRLFRTRRVNTLAFNPHMPYHDPGKPYVNHWFSSTKGFLPRLFSLEGIDELCRERGASIVYQYLHKYVDLQGTIRTDVRECLERIASDNRLYIRPVTVLLDRLKQFQLLFTVKNGDKAILVNASRDDCESVQVLMDGEETVAPAFIRENKRMRHRSLSIAAVPKLTTLTVPIGNLSRTTKYSKARYYGSVAVLEFPGGTVIANLSNERITVPSNVEKRFNGNRAPRLLAGNEVNVIYLTSEAERLQILQPISRRELLQIFMGQATILLREHLLMGRKISTDSYFQDPGKIEDPSNW